MSWQQMEKVISSVLPWL